MADAAAESWLPDADFDAELTLARWVTGRVLGVLDGGFLDGAEGDLRRKDRVAVELRVLLVVSVWL